MKLSSFLHFVGFGIKTVLFRKKEPILGTVIVTDKCNLKCKHCSVNNITAVVHPYGQIRKEMQQLYDMGIRILFFCGGETFLWRDGERTLRDLVVEAKEMGFLIVNVVTNGTFPIDLPEADLILLSLDGDRERHNAVRGDTYDTIMENIKKATSDNICFYMAINQINKDAVEHVCLTARDTKNVRAVSFNFHTPYPDTGELALSKEEKAYCCDVITRMMKAGAPVFNLRSAFPSVINLPLFPYTTVSLIHDSYSNRVIRRDNSISVFEFTRADDIMLMNGQSFSTQLKRKWGYVVCPERDELSRLVDKYC